MPAPSRGPTETGEAASHRLPAPSRRGLAIGVLIWRRCGLLRRERRMGGVQILTLGRVDEFSAAELFGIPQLNRA
jgi:hypothetical protein